MSTQYTIADLRTRLFEAIATTLADKMGRAELWTLPWDATKVE